MAPNVQVGSILIEDRPLVTRILDLGSESYSAKWVMLKVLDQKLRSVGWNRSFMAEEAEATVFGSRRGQQYPKSVEANIFENAKTELQLSRSHENG
jgi:hypothetical protein